MPFRVFLRPALRRAACLAGAALASGCASFPQLAAPMATRADAGPPAAAPDRGPNLPPGGAAEVLRIPDGNEAAALTPPPAATPEQVARLLPDTPVDVTLPPQPVPQFLNAALGDILHLPYALGPEVGARTEVISLRTAPRTSRRAFLLLLTATLRDYGLVLSIENGAVQVREAPSLSARAQVLRGHATTATPDGLRSTTQIVQLYALDAGAVQPLLQDVFPNARAVRITPVPATNSLVVSGSARDVAATADMIGALDQPRFAGAEVARIEPVYWRAEAFARALADTLITEGFIVSGAPTTPRGIMILPLPTTNQVLAFAGDPQVMARVRFWAAKIDQPSAVGEQRSTFVYVVRNTDAASLGALARGQSPQPFTPIAPVGVGSPGSPGASSLSSLGGATGGTTTTGGLGSSTQTPVGVPATIPGFSEGGGSGSGALPGGGSLAVDPIGNRILFTGSATQFAQLHDLLQQLDAPPRQVLIEVTVAEVTLNDQTSTGLEWFFNHSELGGGQQINGGTLNNLGLAAQPQGLKLGYLNTLIPGIQSLQAQFNAFASNNKVNILSKPRIVAKSGGDAQIQVGSDIPIVSSQAAGAIQTGGVSQVIQSIEYRQTGVILRVKPTIYGEDRVNIEVSQEVSNVVASTNTAIVSPTIQNRSIATELSLQDGATAVLGGLISSTYSKANSGIPYLKDVPVLGLAFRTDDITGQRDELVVLLTPHIVHDADEMTAVAGGLSGEINRAFRVGTGASYTLSPIATGFNLGPGPSAKPRGPDLDAALADVRARKAAGAPPPPLPPAAVRPGEPAASPSAPR